MSAQVPNSASELFPGYVGEVDKDSLPHNFGSITFPNGNRYEGKKIRSKYFTEFDHN